MKKFTITATLNSYERKKSSVYGNPCYSITFADIDGNTYTGKTAANASCAYRVCGALLGKMFDFVCHHTPSVALIIDYIND